MYLTKTKAGHFIPSDEQSREEANKIAPGAEVKATRSRNPQFHRKSFALIKLGFSNQDTYESMEVYRKVITIKAGYYDEIPDKNGSPYYIPKSISFEKMNQQTFEQYFDAVLNVISLQLQTAPEVVRSEVESFM
jgi:hypothetical protein